MGAVANNSKQKTIFGKIVHRVCKEGTKSDGFERVRLGGFKCVGYSPSRSYL